MPQTFSDLKKNPNNISTQITTNFKKYTISMVYSCFITFCECRKIT